MTSFCRLATPLVFTGEGLIQMKLKEHGQHGRLTLLREQMIASCSYDLDRKLERGGQRAGSNKCPSPHLD
jgi:hypothetical protein